MAIAHVIGVLFLLAARGSGWAQDFTFSRALEVPMPSLAPDAPKTASALDSITLDYGAGNVVPAGTSPAESAPPSKNALAQYVDELADLCAPPPSQCGLYFFHGYSSWRGISEGSGSNNNGLLYGANLGTRLGSLSDFTGIGAQLGATYGLYDLNGRSSGFADNMIQQQTFVTAGLFRKADAATNFSGAVVFDAMWNDRFGQFAVSPFLTQLRAQLAYALNESHEIGVWTALRMSGANRNVFGPLSFRGVDQFNLFWHHRFAFGADGWTWIGVPDHTKLGGHGSLGDYIFGGTLMAPLSPRLGTYTDLQYMRPSAHLGAAAAREESFYIGIGLVFYPTRTPRSGQANSAQWMPYMPVANNGSFMVDTNRTF